MLKLSKSLVNVPILSLRIGGEVGTATQPIINPTNLKIEGWRCVSSQSKDELILLSQDVREVLPQGLVVNDVEVLADPEDLIRHQKLLEIDFGLLGHNVVSESKRKLGKVSDFATETTTFYIQKLYTTQSILKSLKGGSTSVSRNQILEITDRQIVVKDPLQPTPAVEQVLTPADQTQPLPATPIQ
jgi:hypothetical protein